MATEKDSLIETETLYGSTDLQDFSMQTSDRKEEEKEAEDKKVPGHPTAAKDHMLFIGLMSMMVVLVAAVCSLSLSQYVVKNGSHTVGMEILIIYMTIGIIVIALMCCKSDVSVQSRSRLRLSSFRARLKVILRHFLSIVGMSIFYPFSCLHDLLHVIAAIYCSGTLVPSPYGHYRKHVVTTMFHVMRILFMGAELVFCYRFHSVKFLRKGSVRCGLVIIMIVNVGLWFITVLFETIHRREEGLGNVTRSLTADHPYSVSNATVNPHAHECKTENPALYRILEKGNLYLYPFSIEFSLLVGEFLADKFFSCQDPTETTAAVVRPLSRFETVEGSQDETQSEIQEDFGRIRCRMVIMTLVTALGIFVNVVCIALSFNISFQALPEGVVHVYLIVYWILAIVLTILGFGCGGVSNLQQKQMRGLDCLIMISAFGPLVANIIDSVAVAQNLSVDGVHLKPYLATQITNLIQISFQVPFLFYSDRVRFESTWGGSVRRGAFRGIMLYMAMCNITHWICDSLQVAYVDNMESKIQEFYTRTSTRVFIEGIFLPLGIFFRFNSFLLFVRAFLGS